MAEVYYKANGEGVIAFYPYEMRKMYNATGNPKIGASLKNIISEMDVLWIACGPLLFAKYLSLIRRLNINVIELRGDGCAIR